MLTKNNYQRKIGTCEIKDHIIHSIFYLPTISYTLVNGYVQLL